MGPNNLAGNSAFKTIENQDAASLQLILQCPEAKPTKNMLMKTLNGYNMFEIVLSHSDMDIMTYALHKMIDRHWCNRSLWKHIHKVLSYCSCLTPNHLTSLCSYSDRSFSKLYDSEYRLQLSRAFGIQLELAVKRYWFKRKSSLAEIRSCLDRIRNDMIWSGRPASIGFLEDYTNEKLKKFGEIIKLERTCYPVRSLVNEMVYAYNIVLWNNLPHEMFVHISEYIVDKK